MDINKDSLLDQTCVKLLWALLQTIFGLPSPVLVKNPVDSSLGKNPAKPVYLESPQHPWCPVKFPFLHSWYLIKFLSVIFHPMTPYSAPLLKNPQLPLLHSEWSLIFLIAIVLKSSLSVWLHLVQFFFHSFLKELIDTPWENCFFRKES